MPPEAVFAEHANAHYTDSFTRTDDLFCSLSFIDLVGRLDPSQFVRIHRSHIVNLEQIVAVRRAGDTGQVELAGSARRIVPVSRAKLSSLKAQVGTLEHLSQGAAQ
jgi:DNA-binding LytR/AlgR family response regulator